ncbi:MAG: DUF1343 domain-containing protein [Luteococcus sp.]|uniref:exo-beta-N-acetylmuramidase NamZ family protein n=1 Tax=Luteococcus sp. TaxID=1969402 RepID=UPI002647D30A|nr:DUF1343 domain-containing protein [Luteococcus sp.]MDN5562645.1 DUF1343 domain-containing protein [Luteococcus sp.]
MDISRRKLVAAAGLGAVAAPFGPLPAQASSGRGRGQPGRVVTGAQAQADAGWPTLKGHRVGVISNPTGVLEDLTHIVDRMHADGVDVAAVFGPEHGFRGTAQAGGSEGSAKDPRTGITVHDAYGANDKGFAELFAASKVDTVVFDIQDVGVRFYTYIWTMYQAMRGAAQVGGIRFVVLDRPNPIGRAARGPLLDMTYSSGVGLRSILMQHGMTVGELATMFDAEYLPREKEAKRLAELEVVRVRGWKGELFDETGLQWVMPSPNMPTPTTALVYPGTGLFEATNMSEGRGTTRPFELVGAPWVDHRWAERLNSHGLPGVLFREAYFMPTISKNAEKVNGGVQVHVTDPSRINAPELAVHMFCDARDLHEDFDTRVIAWDKYPWEWLDKLTGTARMREQLTSGASAQQIVAAWADDEKAWQKRRRPHLLYPAGRR